MRLYRSREVRPRRVVGDTTGAPPGCSTAAAVATIVEWFAAFQAADSARLARASPGGVVVSMGGFASADSFVTFGFLDDVVRYARRRVRQHERFTLEGIRFYGWRGRVLGFMPYYQRSADDLGPAPIAGVGKAEYHCGRGVAVLNLAPRPAFDPGL